MQKENSVTLTGVFKTEQVTPTFAKQVLAFSSKDRDNQWKEGNFEIYIKPDLVQQSGIQPGDNVKIKGFMVFNFFTKQDGTQMSFPKLIVSEVVEREVGQGAQAQAGAQPGQPQIQPTQPTTLAASVPPVPGQAPSAPVAPAQPQAAQPTPPVPPMPQPM